MKVEDSRYVFEAKTIKRMEILVLSSLGWKMNPVTPLSFLDYITRRLGLKDHLCWEFLRRCEGILLCVIAGKFYQKTLLFLNWALTNIFMLGFSPLIFLRPWD